LLEVCLHDRLKAKYRTRLLLKLQEKERELSQKFQHEFDQKLHQELAVRDKVTEAALDVEDQMMSKNEIIASLQEQLQQEKKISANLNKIKLDVEQELVTALNVERSRTGVALDALVKERKSCQEQIKYERETIEKVSGENSREDSTFAGKLPRVMHVLDKNQATE
jgi:hypothetical protein